MKYAAVNPADFYSVRTGGYGFEKASFPHCCGHDGIGVVMKVTHERTSVAEDNAQVGPGVTTLFENDWVIPFKPFFGSWSTAIISKASDLLKVC